MNEFEILELTEKKIKKALNLMGHVSSSININLIITLDNLSCKWSISFSNIKKIEKANKNIIYKISIGTELWEKYIVNDISYDDLTFGGHLFVEQGEKGYNNLFHRILRNIHSKRNILLLSDYEVNSKKDIKMLKIYKSKTYKISRFCPHQAFDLINCDVDENGDIQCPAHGWKFNIVNGRCVRGDLTKKL